VDKHLSGRHRLYESTWVLAYAGVLRRERAREVITRALIPMQRYNTRWFIRSRNMREVRTSVMRPLLANKMTIVPCIRFIDQCIRRLETIGDLIPEDRSEFYHAAQSWDEDDDVSEGSIKVAIDFLRDVVYGMRPNELAVLIGVHDLRGWGLDGALIVPRRLPRR
jgi:hypothetical protein